MVLAGLYLLNLCLLVGMLTLVLRAPEPSRLMIALACAELLLLAAHTLLFASVLLFV